MGKLIKFSSNKVIKWKDIPISSVLKIEYGDYGNVVYAVVRDVKITGNGGLSITFSNMFSDTINNTMCILKPFSGSVLDKTESVIGMWEE